MRNNVPGGECVGESQPPGVEKAGGAAGDDLIESLRETIRLIERVPVSLTFPPALGSGPLPGPACSLSLPAPPEEEGLIPRARGSAVAAASSPPFHKIGAAGLHELKPAAYRDAPAALCFALAWAGMYPARASRQGFSLLWCLTDRGAREWGAPYGPGLLTLGLDPASVLIVKARNGLDAAWALEEGLKAQVFTAALGQIDLKAPLMARRLGLAAQAGRTPCLLLSSHQGGGLPGSLTRWRIEAAPSRKAQFDAASPGPPSWRLTLERCRGEAPGRTWIVEYGDDAYGIGLSAELADRAAQSGEEQRALSG